MSDFLALDWEHRQVCGLDAEVSADGVVVRQAFVLDWPDGKSPDVDVPAAGSWLVEQFQKLGLTPKPVLVTVPREDAVVRVIEVPNVSDSELPDVVKYQAASKSARSLDTMLLDFLPLPTRPGIAGREVLVATIGKEVVDAMRLVLSRTGCELAGISLTAPALVELVARCEKTEPPLDPQGTELTIIIHGQRVEIAFLRQRSLLLTHSARLPDDATDADRQRQAVVAEVNRSLVALKRQFEDASVSRTWIWGDAESCRQLGEVIGKRFHCAVKVADPLKSPGITAIGINNVGSHALFTGPAGLLLSQAGKLTESLDFLHPRQPVVPKDFRRLYGLSAAAAAVVIFGSAFWIRSVKVNNRSEDARKAQAAATDITDQLRMSKSAVEAADIVQKWNSPHASWLDRLSELTTVNESTERRYFSKLTMQSVAGVNGEIIGNCFAKDRDDVEDLSIKLSARPGIVVPVPEPKGKGSDGDYTARFDLKITWRPVEAKAAKITPPEKK